MFVKDNKNSIKTINACGTISHMSPELILKGHLNYTIDIYALGIIMWEIYTGERIYNDIDQNSIVNHVVIEHGRPRFPIGTEPFYKDLASRCWNRERHSRPNINEITTKLSEYITSKTKLELKQ